MAGAHCILLLCLVLSILGHAQNGVIFQRAFFSRMAPTTVSPIKKHIKPSETSNAGFFCNVKVVMFDLHLFFSNTAAFRYFNVQKTEIHGPFYQKDSTGFCLQFHRFLSDKYTLQLRFCQTVKQFLHSLRSSRLWFRNEERRIIKCPNVQGIHLLYNIKQY